MQTCLQYSCIATLIPRFPKTLTHFSSSQTHLHTQTLTAVVAVCGFLYTRIFAFQTGPWWLAARSRLGRLSDCIMKYMYTYTHVETETVTHPEFYPSLQNPNQIWLQKSFSRYETELQVHSFITSPDTWLMVKGEAMRKRDRNIFDFFIQAQFCFKEEVSITWGSEAQ